MTSLADSALWEIALRSALNTPGLGSGIWALARTSGATSPGRVVAAAHDRLPARAARPGDQVGRVRSDDEVL